MHFLWKKQKNLVDFLKNCFVAAAKRGLLQSPGSKCCKNTVNTTTRYLKQMQADEYGKRSVTQPIDFSSGLSLLLTGKRPLTSEWQDKVTNNKKAFLLTAKFLVLLSQSVTSFAHGQTNQNS